MKVDPDDLISYDGIVEETGCTRSTLRAWVSRGVLPAPLRSDLGVPIWERSVILEAVRARMDSE